MSDPISASNNRPPCPHTNQPIFSTANGKPDHFLLRHADVHTVRTQMIQQDILWFEVSVDDPPGVQVTQRQHKLSRVEARAPLRETLLPAWKAAEARRLQEEQGFQHATQELYERLYQDALAQADAAAEYLHKKQWGKSEQDSNEEKRTCKINRFPQTIEPSPLILKKSVNN